MCEFSEIFLGKYLLFLSKYSIYNLSTSSKPQLNTYQHKFWALAAKIKGFAFGDVGKQAHKFNLD